MEPAFANRQEAGTQLATLIVDLDLEHPLVLGLPRGGVPVAAEVAARLGADLDVVLIRKVGHPHQPELALGALGETDVVVLNETLIDWLGVSRRDLGEIMDRERAELQRRADAYRAGRARIPLQGRTAVLVDDGIATGASIKAAVEVVRRAGAKDIVLAVPVAPREFVDSFGEGRVVALRTPANLGSVGQFYRDFAQVSDQEVVALLGQ